MRVAVILLACGTALVAAQFPNIDSPLPKGLPVALRPGRLQRLPSARPVPPTQSAFANQRLRRPITFRPKGAEDGIGTGPGSFIPSKPLRPLPTGPVAALPQQVKPVNEEAEEEVRNRESFRDRENQENDSEISEELSGSNEESDENVSRAIANLGAVSSISRSSNVGPTGPPPAPVQYRPSYQGAIPTGRGGINAPTASPVQPVQYRSSPKPNKPRKQIDEPFKQQVKPQLKPVKQSEAYDGRGKKPVAQIIRRYRNDNPDGSITWGFENDDGSYKEEIIGIDCITRGKYGYIDPDGIRREYTYETGIKCDEQQREEEENGFVDYQENKLVLPDGKTIDLSSMGKKQARRPSYIQRN